MKRAPLITAAAALLTSCSNEKSVADYKAQPNERASRVEECLRADDHSQDCRNAKQAEFEALGISAKNGVASGQGTGI